MTSGEAPATRPARLGPTETLRDRIIEHLKRGPDSISGLARELSRDRQAPIHRLTVAGYLQALTETGVLRELDRPPSKMYQLQNPEAHWSLHQRVHRHIAQQGRHEWEAAQLGLAVLQTLLQRPIFHAELVHAGFSVPEGLPKQVVPDGVRRQYRDMLGKRASPRIELAPRDALYQLPADHPMMAHVEDVIRRLLVKSAGADHLMSERTGPEQAQLDLGA